MPNLCDATGSAGATATCVQPPAASCDRIYVVCGYGAGTTASGSGSLTFHAIGPVLVFPLLDKVIIGTSDIPIENPDEARCTEAEISYFFEMIGRVFPNIKIGREQVVFQFSGVRPLEYSHAKTTGQITRDHSIKEDKLGDIPVYSLVGGKWTSYRAFSEQTADKAMALLGKTRKADTKHLSIGGGRDYTQVKDSKECSPELFARYGSRCREISAYQAGDDSPLRIIPP